MRSLSRTRATSELPTRPRSTARGTYGGGRRKRATTCTGAVGNAQPGPISNSIEPARMNAATQATNVAGSTAARCDREPSRDERGAARIRGGASIAGAGSRRGGVARARRRPWPRSPRSKSRRALPVRVRVACLDASRGRSEPPLSFAARSVRRGIGAGRRALNSCDKCHRCAICRTACADTSRSSQAVSVSARPLASVLAYTSKVRGAPMTRMRVRRTTSRLQVHSRVRGRHVRRGVGRLPQPRRRRRR